MADYAEPYLTLKLTGINYDTPAYDLPLDQWSEGRNVRFSDTATEKFPGHRQVFGTLLNDPNWFMPVGYGPAYYWLYASNTAIACTDMATHSDITPVAGVTANLDTNWNGGLINNLAVLNNGADAPIWWTGSPSDKMTTLPGWPAAQLAAVVRPYKNYLVAMNISDAVGDYPDMLQWSDSAAPGYVPASWDVAAPTNDAGQTELSDTPGEIIDGAQLGDSFVIYKRDSCYIMQYSGGHYIHTFRKLFSNVGAMAANCIGILPGKRHLVLTADDLVVHDGSSAPTSVLDNRMRSWLFRVINQDYYQRSFIVPNYEQREMWVCVPAGESAFADIALVWNYENNTIGLRDIPLSRYAASGIIDPGESTAWDDDPDAWDTDSTTWNERTFSPTSTSIMLGVPGKLLETGRTATFAGELFESYISRESMPLIDRHNIKLVKGIYPKMAGTGNPTVYFRVGGQMNATDPVEWGPDMPFVVGVDDKLDCLVKGRYISLRCYSYADISWQLYSVDVEIELAERR